MASAPHEGSALERHVLGRGRFTADLDAPDALFAAFVRSPHAHARIESVRTAAAAAMPGVAAVFTAGEVAAAGFGPMPTAPMRGADGRPIATPRWPVLAETRVGHVGQPVALVVAASEWAALDAAEAVEVAYDALPAATGSGDAPGTVLLRWTAGDAGAVDAAMARAARVVHVAVVSQRVAPAPLETRAALALYDPRTGRIDLETPSQGAAFLRRQLLAVTGWGDDRLNVRTADVGGAFGMKTSPYPEQAAVLLAADRLRRSVRWAASRSEAFVSDAQGRDTALSGELALDAEGRFLALLARNRVNLGAFLTTHGAFTACHNFAACIAGCYATPAIAVEVTCVATHRVPVGPYRGAGRPEANLLIEALVDAAARESGLDAVELRRRNIVRPAAMPYRTPLGQVYDSGDFGRALDRAEAAADRAGFPARREESRRRGLLRGFGIGLYLEAAGGLPDESARLQVDADGRVRAFAPGQSSGQSHDASFRRILAGKLGVPPERIDIVQGDAAALPGAGPSVASRSLVAGGTMLAKAADALVEQGRSAAAELLQADADEVAFADGCYHVRGSGRAVSLAETAAHARAHDPIGLDATASGQVPPTYPNGCHAAEVEIDPATGTVTLASYVAVDDVGRVVNHAAVEGQVHGGVAQGVGQALMEHMIYDEAGQPASASFMDYALPRAADLPFFRTEEVHGVPATTNALGAKGAGEGGTTGALGAMLNAVNDALASAGAGPVGLPVTPQRIWRALRLST